MARDQEGRINTARTATLQKIMKFRMEQQQIHDEHMQKRRMHNQELEPKPADSVKYKSSKHKWYKKEESGRGQQSLKQPANTLSRHHQTSLTPKSIDHFSETNLLIIFNCILFQEKVTILSGKEPWIGGCGTTES
ncbi:hypothetical protein Bca4012_020337 [Brassica carinata]